jgi:head-tail adaptor
MALRQVNPGNFDHIITFYSPTKSKDAIGDSVKTLSSAGAIRAERIFKSSTERIEAQQQVGVTTQDFRIRDGQFALTYEWEFDVISIASPANVSRYKVRGIQKEGRLNSVIVTGEFKDNG